MPTDPASESLWVSFRDLRPKGKMGHERTTTEPDQVVCTDDLFITIGVIEVILMF